MGRKWASSMKIIVFIVVCMAISALYLMCVRNNKDFSYILSCFVGVLILCLVGIAIFTQAKERMSSYNPKIIALKNRIRPLFESNIEYDGLLQKMNQLNLDQLEIFEGNKSYTLEKQKIYLCLKKQDGNYYNESMLTHVLLHELSHMICDSMDEVTHSQKFYDTFQRLLDVSKQLGVYDSDDELAFIVHDYCPDSDSQTT